MKKQISQIRQSLKKFHENEAGLEALQVVMIIAVASIMLIFVKTNWEQVKTWFGDLFSQVTGWTS